MMAHEDPAFPTTHWTLVARLHSGDEATAKRALGEILEQYRYTLYVYIRRRDFTHHDAEDVLQEFMAKLLRVRALEGVSEERGRLRGFLGAALRNFLADWRRDEGRRNDVERPAGTATGADEARYARERFSAEDTPERIFDRKWALALMSRVLARLKAQWDARGKSDVFVALRPVVLSGGSLVGHDVAALAAQLGMREGNLRVTLSRLLRDYRDLLKAEVLQTVECVTEVAEEIEHLKSVFAGR